MTACTCASRTILIIFNIIFMILGLALAIAGGLLAWNYAVVMKLLDEQILPNIENSQSTEEAVRSLVKSLSPFGIGIFVTGMIIICLCALGLFGAICYNRCVLAIYLVLHGVLLLGEIIMIIIYAVKPELITDQAKVALEQGVVRYVSATATDADSVLWNALMTTLQCCGVNNGDDIKNSPNYNNQYEYQGQTLTSEYPPTCCKLDSNKQPVAGCPQSFTSDNSNKDIGCWSILKKEMDVYGKYILYACIGIAGLQLILVIACIILVCSNKE